MTVNIGLVTSDAFVVGCDSIASVNEYFLDPFSRIERDSDGSPVLDPDGNYSVKFKYDDLQSLVTNAWGGVTKMFEIHCKPCPVIAVTAGLAKMRGRTIASLGADFLAARKADDRPILTVGEIAKSFLDFMREHYDEHYSESDLPDILRDGPEFLVGGFGRDDEFPSLYRLNVQANEARPEFIDGKFGVAWNGQSDAVERLIRGYDSELRVKAENKVKASLRRYHNDANAKVVDIVNSILSSLGAEMPAGIDVQLPPPEKVTLPWKNFRLPISFGYLPLQEAVHVASFLVNLQAGKARFARGVPTVGGHLHLGVVTREHGFKLLNEPELVHKYTGFGDDN